MRRTRWTRIVGYSESVELAEATFLREPVRLGAHSMVRTLKEVAGRLEHKWERSGRKESLLRVDRVEENMQLQLRTGVRKWMTSP